MKNLKYFFYAAIMALAVGITFSSCKKDDEILPEGGYVVDDSNVQVGLYDQGNKLLLVIKTSSGQYTYTVTYTASFDGTSDAAICTSCYIDTKYNIPGIPDQHEEASQFVGETKGNVRKALQITLDAYNNSNRH